MLAILAKPATIASGNEVVSTRLPADQVCADHCRSRSALAIAETELNDIAAATIIGLSNVQVTSRNALIAFFSYPTRKIIHKNVDISTDV